MESRHKPIPILLIEDESAIADTVVYSLDSEGFESKWCTTGEDGLAAFREMRPALVILDIGLPDANGLDLFRQLQEISPVPVIFLTARGTEIDRVVGLEIGADDYIVKPFSPRELTARVRAVLRRADPGMVQEPATNESPFQIEQEAMRIHCHGQLLELSRYEYRLLKLLIESQERVYTRGQLLQLVWENPDHSIERTVDTHIKTLRNKLRAVHDGFDPIKTHRGTGYSLSLRD
ncbi:MAG: two-component system response regulator CreB [Candidatus Thiodiazotropha sp. (ex Epidulcina cf. delphinae)]|nr:two-component system response regulator CreB [Candidatus Thiodiazotropha sp. (ex Epidulcina cf. delphinae)]